MTTGDTPPTSRALVLDDLLAAGRPVDVDELSRRRQLHPNTVRLHLDALVRSGLERHLPTGI